MRVLVTGGAGFIGSHTCVELLAAGHEVVVVDNLSNSSPVALERIQELAPGPLVFEELDLLDHAALDRVLDDHEPDAVIHFAGLKAVGESVDFPLRYYRNNVAGTVNLLDAMHDAGVKHLVFSSSATVYGDPESSPIPEGAPLSASNPYGRTKLMIEEMLRDVAQADDEWRIAALRYFNPVGAHPSGRIGEDPRGIPNNLMPFIMQVAVGRRERLSVFGGDYPTRDGTGERDYIHVVDLALGHLAALDVLSDLDGCVAYNLGTGSGHTVLEVVAECERAVGHEIAYEIVPRRSGDAAITFADPARAERELGWRAERGLDAMCADAWNWQRNNPGGYEPS